MIDSRELRSSIQKGLKRDDTDYIQELGSLLDAYTINTGARFSLGGDTDTAQRVSDLLGIDESLHDGSLDVLSVSIGNTYTNSIKGTLRPFVKETGVVPALALIQASEWQYDHFSRLWSNISVGNTGEHPVLTYEADKQRPLVALSAMAIYSAAQQTRFRKIFSETLPPFGRPEATRYTPANEAEVPAKALKRYIDSRHTENADALVVPIKKYWLEVGPPTDGINTTVVMSRSHFLLHNGHFVPERFV